MEHDLIGVYSNDLTKKSREGLNEDSEGEETYRYDSMIGDDMGRLHHLEREKDHSHGGHKSNLEDHINNFN